MEVEGALELLSATACMAGGGREDGLLADQVSRHSQLLLDISEGGLRGALELSHALLVAPVACSWASWPHVHLVTLAAYAISVP